MTGAAAALLLALVLGFAAGPAAVGVRAAANDTAALLELKAALTGGASDALLDWEAGGNPCSSEYAWSGVECSGGRVIAVNLSNYALSGTLPASLDLSELEVLDLSSNQLHNSLPANLTLPRLQRFNLGDNKLMGPLPASWAANFPELGELTLRGNDLAGTLPPAWMADSGFATPFRAVLQPGNPLLCGGVVSSGANHTLWYSDAVGGLEHEIVTTLGSCAQGECGTATVNASAPNLFDLAWSNGVSTLDLESWNELVQANGAPKLGTPITLPCYPSNAPTFFGANAAHRMATWQSSTDGARVSSLPVSGAQTISSAEDCSATADAPAFWMVDIQRNTKVQAVLIRPGPEQMQGVIIRVSETPDPTAGIVCKSNLTFDPSLGKIVVCERPNKGRYISISAQSRVSLCQVEVYPESANAALGKPTTSSGADDDTTQASQVVNGNMANIVCAQVSTADPSAWITIDLGYEARVDTVVVQNGYSNFDEKSGMLFLRLGNTPVVNGSENELCSQGQELGERLTKPIQCLRAGGLPASGRFLTLYRASTQASDMYICQVLVFLADSPNKFYLSPPSPPSPPTLPPPAPSPPAPVDPGDLNVIDSSVGATTTVMEVVLDIEGSERLLPLTAETQENIVLAAQSTWVGQDGVLNVSSIDFTFQQTNWPGATANGSSGSSSGSSAGAIVTPRLQVVVSAGLAAASASFIVGTSQDGSLEKALRDQGGQLANVTGTVVNSIRALPLSPPLVSPPPAPDGSIAEGGTNSNTGGSSVPIGAIVGGVVGGLALAAGLVGLLYVRRQRRRGGPAPHDSASESPKELGIMEQGRSSPLMDFPKPGDMGNGYSVAALAAAAGGSGNFTEQLRLAGEVITQGPPADVISFLSEDAGSEHSAAPSQQAPQSSLARDSPSGWGGSSTGGGSAVGGGGGGAAGGGGGVARTASEGVLQKQRSNVAPSRIDSGVSELWTVDFRELAIQKQIGEGSFGKVYLAKWRETTVAVKVLGSCGTGNSPGLDDEFPDASVAKSHPLYESLQKEAAMMASLRHPSIVMYLGVCLDPPAVVTEYCARGSLNDVLKRARTSPLLAAQLDWARRLNMALDAAKGMLYLHSCSPPIIHRDLKSANLLVDKHWRVRVCDFNLSRVMEDSAVLSSVAATNPRWLAPEILSGKGYTFASDVYSFGICMWELLTWQVPYYEYGPWQVVAMVTESAKRPEIPPPEELPMGSFSGEAEYLALMQECWAQDIDARPDFAAIISRLRTMLALEASARRESPTKGPRPPHSVLSVGSGSTQGLAAVASGLVSGGDDTPLARSRLASLNTTVASELGASPDPLRHVGSDAETLSGSPTVLGSGRLVGSGGSGSMSFGLPPPPPPPPIHGGGSSLQAAAGVAQAQAQAWQHRLSCEGSQGPARTLSSITGGGTDDAEAAAAAAAAEPAGLAAGGSSRQPAG